VEQQQQQQHDGDFDSDSDSGSDYLSFEGSDDEEEKEARERERRMVLEAAGLILQVDERVKPPKELVRARSLRGSGREKKSRDVSEGTIRPSPNEENDDIKIVGGGGDDGGDGGGGGGENGKEVTTMRKRRPPPAIPIAHTSSSSSSFSHPAQRRSSGAGGDGPPTLDSVDIESSGLDLQPEMLPRRRYKRSATSNAKDLPPLPPHDGENDNMRRLSGSILPTSPSDRRSFDPDEHAKRLDDAFERYESFRNARLSGNFCNNRLSVVSGTSTDTSSLYPPSSPTTTVASMTPVTSKESEKGASNTAPHRSLSNLSSQFHASFSSHLSSQGKVDEHGSPGMTSPSSGSRYGQFLQFLSIGRAKTPEGGEAAGRKFTISGPIPMSASGIWEGEGTGGGELSSDSPAFGSVS
jgi:hypothetical protein